MIYRPLILSIACLVSCSDSSSNDNVTDASDSQTTTELPEPGADALEVYTGVTNPEGVESGFEGIPCEIYFTGESEDGNELYYKTNFGHEDDSHSGITVQFVADQVELYGLGSNNEDEMALLLAEANDRQSLTTVFLKWKHVDHFHYSRCYNLQLVP
ncbi:MAG: hypothetical protein HRU19_30885 [Pseudobacteriovorax sp.]|nr:hypothetical protein [Pseudobacteriovorax sp.]